MSELLLSSDDRRFLERRLNLLGAITKILCLVGAAVMAIAAAKMTYGGGAVDWDAVRPASQMAALYFGCVLATHMLLARWERKAMANIRVDLQAGIKISDEGTLEDVDDADTESSPTRLTIRNSNSNELESFALRTIWDLIRIKPDQLMGKAIVIEYAPCSRIVLQLRRHAQSANTGDS